MVKLLKSHVKFNGNEQNLKQGKYMNNKITHYLHCFVSYCFSRKQFLSSPHRLFFNLPKSSSCFFNLPNNVIVFMDV